MTLSLFEDPAPRAPQRKVLCPGAVVLSGFAIDAEGAILTALREITVAAPFRHMVTPGGFRMSVAMTNCGAYGWVTDRTGYRYDATDPESANHWPPMPKAFSRLAHDAAARAGFEKFAPDSCLINRYEPGARSRCIRTEMSAISASRLSPSRWAFQPSFCLAASGAAIDGCAYR